MTNQVNILHLSDLHFGMEPDNKKMTSTTVDQRNLTLDTLIKMLGNIDDGWKPQVVAITGDIAWKGKAEDYEKAGEWLNDKLLPILNLQPDKLIVCPGNHDIDRDETFGMMPPPSFKEADEWLKLERLKNFTRPFEAYTQFCTDMGLSPLEIGNQQNYLTGKSEMEGVRFVVLNSAWFCRGDDDRNNLWIGKPLLEKMAVNNQLIDPDNYDVDDSPIIIALFHHPPEWLNENECNTFGKRQNTMEYLSFRSHIILNGHVHARPTEPHQQFNRAWLIKGGASYAEYAYLNHFSILKVNIEDRTFHRLSYEFDPGKNKWRKDVEGDNIPFYDLKTSVSVPVVPQLVIPDKYREWIVDECSDMDISRFIGQGVRVDLPKIYIPLLATPPGKGNREQDESIREAKRLQKDIEDLIVENDYLVIRGLAGSGKTTLIRHFAYMMATESNWKGLGGISADSDPAK